MSRWYKDKFLIAYIPDDTQYEDRIAYRGLCNAVVIIFLSCFTLLALSACAAEPTPYRPPTIAVRLTAPVVENTTPTPTSLPVEAPLFLSTPGCEDDLTFLDDLSYPDGSVVRPGERLDKRWLIQNSGSCNWDERYRLKFTAGSELSASTDQALYPARSGTQATLQVSFTAPAEPGSYQSAWQAYNPQGQAFGDPIYLQVVVKSDFP